MLLKSSAKVGLVVLLALALGIGLYTQLAHIRTDSYTVKLNVEDTQGLSAQSVVRMEGVAVGEVSSVDLDHNNKPLIYLAIKRKYRIPKDYIFRITSGILITQAQVSIAPPPPPSPLSKLQPKPEIKVVAFLPNDGTAIVTGAAAPSGLLEAVDPELHNTFATLNQTFATITDKLNNAYGKIDVVLIQTQKLMSTANKIAGATDSVISDPSLKKNLIASLDNVRRTTEDAHLMTSQLRQDMDDLIGSSKGNLKELGTKVNSLLDHVDATVQDTDTVVQKLTEQVTDPHLQQSLQETAELARATLARFNQIASDIHSLTGDPDVQGDLKKTIANLSNASEHGKMAMDKVDQILGKFTNGKPRVPKLPKINILANVSEQLSPTRLRIDLDASIPYGKKGLFDLGLYDVGQDTRLTLQAGNYITSQFDVRYGLYASKIGGGLDYWIQPGTGLRADLWDTNRPRLDVRGLYRVNKNASLWIGGDNLLRTPIPMVGVQLNQ